MMDIAAIGKLFVEIALAIAGAVAAILTWLTRRFRDERAQTNRQIAAFETRMDRFERVSEARRAQTEHIHREVTAIAAKLDGLAASVNAIARETARTTEYLMGRDK